MATLSEKADPRAIEAEARDLWAAQHLPPAKGPVGPAEGPVVHQFEGAFAPQEAGILAVQRAVAADVDARAMILVGRRARGILRREEGGPPTPSPRLEPLLTALGIWVGGDDGRAWDSAPRRPAVQRIVGRLARLGALAVRDVSLRICPACGMARSPERLVYQEEDGETLLVRFPFLEGDRTVSALVWTDAPWRLLGTSALMVHPDYPYVVARYRRHGVEELIFTSKSSLPRLAEWLPGAEVEVLEEHPGQHWQRRSYVHPLRHEFPMGGSMEPPAGTIQPIAEVSDTGTGVVPLVPGHGGTDTQIADRLGVPGWPLVTPKGRFDILFVHKYAGLELESGSEFVGRDLAEGEAIFAHLRVRRGVPHCQRCGTALIWAPGRAWCLEPSRLPAERIALYRALLPHDRPIERLEAVPWPVSVPQRSDDPSAISLLECSACDRVDAADSVGDRCPCGGRRRAVKRHLLPAFDAAVTAWASTDPFPAADSARLYVSARRRAPTVVHQLAAMSGVAGTAAEVRLAILPTLPEVDLPALLAERGADAVRAALVRAQESEGATATFEQRTVQESQRLDAFWRLAREILARVDAPSLAAYGHPIAGAIGELEPEDRAILARLERLRIQCTVDFDRSAPGRVHRHLFHFVENDFATYRDWVAPRLDRGGSPASKRAALHTLIHLLTNVTQLLGPITPHLAEVVHRALRRRRASLFEETTGAVDRALLDETRAAAWDRWVSVVRSADRLRRNVGLPPHEVLPRLVLTVDSDTVADSLRADAPTLERIAGAKKLEVGSPGAPWSGRKRELRPREAEIQRVYASRAAQINHLLRRMPERRALDATGAGFTILVNGQPSQILPSMVEWIETLPERIVPVDWAGGEMYVELPPGRTLPTAPPPPLSPDAFRVVRRVAHRLRAGGPRPELTVQVVATGALAAELAGVANAVAKHLGARAFRVVPNDRELPPGERETGRTKAGAPWSFHLGGASAGKPRAKARPSRIRGARVRPVFAPGELTPTTTDFSAPELIEREESVRALGDELDTILGAPVLGPAKAAAAWDAGLRSVDDFRAASWEAIVGLPGFGRPVAAALVTKFGGVVPPPPPRAPRAVSAPSVPHNGGRPGVGGPTEPTLATAPAPSPPPATTVRSAPTTHRLAPHAVSVPRVAPAPPVPTPPVEPAREPANAVPELPGPSPTSTDPPAPAEPDEASAPTRVDESPDARPLVAAEADAADFTPPSESPASESVPEESVAPIDVETPTVEPSIPSPIPVTESAQSEPAETTAEPPLAPPDADAAVSPTAETPSELPVPAELLPVAPAIEPAKPDDVPQPERDPRAAPIGEGWARREPGPMAGPEEPATAAEIVAEPTQTTASPAAPISDLPAELASALESRETPAAPETPPEPDLSSTTVPETVEPAPDAPSPSAAEPEPPGVGASPAPESDSASPIEPVPEIAVVPPSPPEVTVEPLVPPVVAVPPPPTPPAGPLFPEVAVPSAPEPPIPVVAPPPPAAGVEIAVGPSYVPALERFLEATAAGHQGICVVRDSPERVRAYIGSRPVELRWLTNIGRGAALKPSDLEGFAGFLARAVSTDHVTAFFIEGLEYLVRLHGLERVVERMAEFDRVAREHAARVWVPLNPKLLSSAEVDRFVAVFARGTGSP